MEKPSWWPRNPYPESIFTMKEERYAEIVPDPKLRTGLSGMLGRSFWNIASEDIWEAMQENSQRTKDFIQTFDAWAVSSELCGGSLFDAMLEAREEICDESQ
jgi:hypothetical protein